MNGFLQGLYTALKSFWKKLSATMALVSGTILLSLVYFIVLLPLAFIKRLAGKNGIDAQSGGSSFYKTRDHTYTKADLENAW